MFQLSFLSRLAQRLATYSPPPWRCLHALITPLAALLPDVVAAYAPPPAVASSTTTPTATTPLRFARNRWSLILPPLADAPAQSRLLDEHDRPIGKTLQSTQGQGHARLSQGATSIDADAVRRPPHR